MAAKSDLKIGYISEGLAEIKAAIHSILKSISNNKLKYFLTSILILILVTISYMRAVDDAYYHGYIHGSTGKNMAYSHMDILALKSLNGGDVEAAKEILEALLDTQILSLLMFNYSEYRPWFIALFTKEIEEPTQLWKDTVSRIAVYRKNNPSSSSWLKPGESRYEELMTYLPSDSTVNEGLGSYRPDCAH